MLRRLGAPLAVLMASSMVLVGCSSVVVHTGTGPGDAGAADGIVTIYGDLSQADAELLQESWEGWEEENDITISYESIGNFDTEIVERAENGTAPDLAIFSQPGLVSLLAWENLIQPTPDVVKANIRQFWSNDWAQAVTTADVVYGAPLTASVKGLIWYSPRQFAAYGWDVPTTWNRLVNLTVAMQAKLGAAPWCADFGSDAAAGAAGTDWLEDIVLRQAGPDAYDAWVRHDVKFSDPVIREAFDSAGEILLHPEYVNTSFDDESSATTSTTKALAIAMGDGTCSLAHQGMSFGDTLADPEGANLVVSPGGDVWAFLMPSIVAGTNSVVGGGQVAAAFSNDADTVKVQQYLSSPEWANSRVKLGGVASANNGVDPASASSATLTMAINILQDPKTTFRFDASDAMPRAVGAGTFPTAMGMWVDNWSPDQMVSTIDRSWAHK